MNLTLILPLIVQRNHQKNLLVLATVFQVFWLITVNIGFHCDSPAYFSNAWHLLGDPVDELSTWVRGASYPLLIVASGTVGTKFSFLSFAPLILIQSSMGILMPILIYKILSHVERNFAYAISVFIIISLQTVIASKLIMTEQATKFFYLLIIFVVLEILVKNRVNLNYFLLALSSYFLIFLKQQFIILIPLCYLFLFFKCRFYFKKNCYSLFFVCLLFFVNSHLVNLSTTPDASVETSKSIASKVADLAFFTIYMNDNLASDEALFKNLKTIIDSFSSEYNSSWIEHYPDQQAALNLKMLLQPGTDYYDYFFISPNSEKYKTLKNLINLYNQHGHNSVLKISASDFIMRYSASVYLQNPKFIFSYFYKYSFFLGGGSNQLLFNKLFAEWRTIRFSPDSGPASFKYSKLIKDYLKLHSNEYRGYVPELYFTNYNDVDQFLVDHLYGIPDPYLRFNYWLIITSFLGNHETDNLYFKVIKETLAHTYPQNSLLGLEKMFYAAKVNSLQYLFNPFLNFNYFYKIVYCHVNTTGGKGSQRWEQELRSGFRLLKPSAVIPFKPIDETYSDWFTKRDHWFINAESSFDMYVGWTWVLTHYLVAMIIVFLTPIALLSNFRFQILSLFSSLALLILLSSVFANPDARYVDVLMPLAIILAGLCIMGTKNVICSSYAFLTNHR